MNSNIQPYADYISTTLIAILGVYSLSSAVQPPNCVADMMILMRETFISVYGKLFWALARACEKTCAARQCRVWNKPRLPQELAHSSPSFMPTFPSNPLTSQPVHRILRKYPGLFGIPFLILIVGASFGLQSFTQTRYDLHDQKIQQVRHIRV